MVSPKLLCCLIALLAITHQQQQLLVLATPPGGQGNNAVHAEHDGGDDVDQQDEMEKTFIKDGVRTDYDGNEDDFDYPPEVRTQPQHSGRPPRVAYPHVPAEEIELHSPRDGQSSYADDRRPRNLPPRRHTPPYDQRSDVSDGSPRRPQSPLGSPSRSNRREYYEGGIDRRSSKLAPHPSFIRPPPSDYPPQELHGRSRHDGSPESRMAYSQDPRDYGDDDGRFRHESDRIREHYDSRDYDDGYRGPRDDGYPGSYDEYPGSRDRYRASRHEYDDRDRYDSSPYEERRPYPEPPRSNEHYAYYGQGRDGRNPPPPYGYPPSHDGRGPPPHPRDYEKHGRETDTLRNLILHDSEENSAFKFANGLHYIESYYKRGDDEISYPISEEQYAQRITSATMTKRIDTDIMRVWMPIENIKKTIAISDNAKVAIAYDKIAAHVSNSFGNEKDEWTRGLGELQSNWKDNFTKESSSKPKSFLGKVSAAVTKDKQKFMKQLFNYSVLGRKALLYVSLYNATFGMSETDFDDLNEIMVTITKQERAALNEMHSTFYKKSKRLLCVELIIEESSINQKHEYKELIESLCKYDREESFKPEDANFKKYWSSLQQLMECKTKNDLNAFWNKYNGGETEKYGEILTKMLTKMNYELLRLVLKSYQENNGDKLIYRLEEAINGASVDIKPMMSLVYTIIIDALYGRPYMIAIILRQKLEKLNYMLKNNEDKDTFNDLSRIFLLHGPIDLANIEDVYVKASKQFYKPPSPPVIKKSLTKVQTKKHTSKEKAAAELTAIAPTNLIHLTLDQHIIAIRGILQNGRPDESDTLNGYLSILKVCPKQEKIKIDDKEENNKKDKENEKERVILKEDANGVMTFGTLNDVETIPKNAIAEKSVELPPNNRRESFSSRGYPSQADEGIYRRPPPVHPQYSYDHRSPSSGGYDYRDHPNNRRESFSSRGYPSQADEGFYYRDHRFRDVPTPTRGDRYVHELSPNYDRTASTFNPDSPSRRQYSPRDEQRDSMPHGPSTRRAPSRRDAYDV